jgi:hypothetical protein
MSHPNQMTFVQSVRSFFPDSFTNKKVLEIGSLNINGSVRQFFNNCEYLGVDIGEGKDVDMVCKGHELPFDNLSFDTVISCECLEHDVHWTATFATMCRLAKGMVIMTCATNNRPEHGTTATNADAAPFTNDYYRNLAIHDFVDNFELHGIFKHFGFEINSDSQDLYFWGKK